MFARGAFAWLALGMLIMFSLDAVLIVVVSSFVPEPYMDEIFHVKQMRTYCAGNFEEWDPKITTPPGLYLISFALIRPLISMMGAGTENLICTAPILRLLNSLHLSLLYLLIYALLDFSVTKKGGSSMRSFKMTLLAAGTTVSFPLIFFFTFLYYTDLLSVITVMGMYCLHQRKFHIFSGIFGAAACMMRQTNLVWVLFTAALTAYNICLDFMIIYSRKKYGNSWQPPKKNLSIGQVFIGICEVFRDRPLLGVQMISAVFARTSVYLLVVLSFGVFALINKGLALGDKSAHEVVFHLPQFCYCLGFITAFGAPILLRPDALKSGLRTILKQPKLTVLSLISCAIVVWGFTYDHPYLLADNRHYTFYIWKNWFQRHWLAKYLLVPAYIFSAVLISDSLRIQSQIWRLGFFVCVALVTVPNRLLEFRYFIIPYLMWRLHTDPSVSLRRKVVVAELVMFSLVNIVTLGLFLFKPFQWTHEPGIQRFMW